MSREVDTVVIGGGPAGASCAITLQKLGVPHLLLDKCTFPRNKTCGGLMTQKTYDLLAEKLLPGKLEAAVREGLFREVSHTLELFDRTERLTRSQLEQPLRSVRRFDFDHFLIRQYRALGGTLLEGERGYRLELANHRLVLRSGERIAFRHLVAADGALSKTRAALRCEPPQLGFCVETFVPKALLPEVDAVQVCFGAVPAGYAWVFPSGRELCIGLGGIYEKQTDYPALLRDFLSSLGLDADAFAFKGAFVPAGKPVDQRGTPQDVLLIGDAGGFVDPIYGEGLYCALDTGIAAAEAIADGGALAKARFLQNTAALSRLLRQGVQMQRIFFRERTLRRFLQRIRGKDRFVGFYSDNHLSAYRYSYAGLWKLLLQYHTKLQ